MRFQAPKTLGVPNLKFDPRTFKNYCLGASIQDKLATSDASFAKSKAKGKERKKKIKSLSKSLDNLHSEVARLSAALNQATILEVERDEDDSEAEDAPLKFFPSFRGNIQGVMLLEPLRVITSTYIPENRGSPEHCPHSKRDTRCDGGLFLVVSERISFVPTDVVVALSVGGKGDGSVPSSIVEEFGFAPGALLVALPFLLLLVSSIDGLVLIPTDTSWLRNSSFIVSSLVNTSAFRFKIFGRCVIQNLWNRIVASIISSLYLLSCSVAGFCVFVLWFPSTLKQPNVNDSMKNVSPSYLD
ncbi:hypothetical protein Tco_0010679 [Tanacetum coccineum]